MIDETVLRAFLARILGWSEEQALAVDHALRSIALSVTYRAALVLLGDADLVSIAFSLHRRTIGPLRPFVICNPVGRDHGGGPAYLPPSRPTGVAAFHAARGGSMCIRSACQPRDFSQALELARDPGAMTQVIVCAEEHFYEHPFLMLPVPVRIPPLRRRRGELPRVIDEYAADAIRELAAEEGCFTDADRQWVLKHCAETLTAIESATLRLTALRMSTDIEQAGKRLGIRGAALRQWHSRRRRGGRRGVRGGKS